MMLRTTLLFAVLLVFSISSHAATSLMTSLDVCIDSRFTEGEASQINDEFNIAETCPELFEHVLHNNSLQQFDPPLEDITSINQLLDVKYLLSQGVRPGDAIYTVVDNNFRQQFREANDFVSKPVEIGLWDQFIEWLKERYKDEDDSDSDWSWLIELLEKGSMPDWLGKAIYYVAVGLIIVLAGLIVFNELRAANIGKWRSRRKNKVSAEWQAGLATIEELNWANIDKLPLQQRAGAMLRFVIDDMIERGWISDNRSRTNREMWRELRQKDTATAKQFDHAINLTERSVYGDEQLDNRQVEDLYQVAHSIIAEQAEVKS
jgi:hypothetical protein